jgi:hypothetical protein
MQGDKCMMMHENKNTNNSKKGIFLGRYTTQEQRDWRRSSCEAASATTSHMGSVLTN